MGAAELQAFLTRLAKRPGASVPARKQALAAMISLYQSVLGADLPRTSGLRISLSVSILSVLTADRSSR